VWHLQANSNTSSESWTATLSSSTVADQVLRDSTDWDPALISLIRNTPEETINDWLLMFRDPQPNWVSPKGRVVQCGDSAHPFLPTSANGATQAMEDAVSLAAALRLGIDASATLKESAATYNELRSVW
jgi:2-polyprenyl-6-methoxyphenol hydroxylase-like FAD-dependent oxidoreductase